MCFVVKLIVKTKLKGVNGESCDKTNCPATDTLAFIPHII